MTEYTQAMKYLATKKSTCILKYPSGKYGLVGTIPIELTTKSTSVFSPDRKSMAWDTEEGVINALLSIGITKFQRADCTWYSL